MKKQSIIKTIYFKSMEEIEQFVHILNKYDNINVDIKYGKYVVDGKSYLGVLSFGLSKDLIIEFNEYDENLITELKENFSLKDFN